MIGAWPGRLSQTWLQGLVTHAYTTSLRTEIMANSRQGTGKVQFRGMIPQSQRLLSQSVRVATRYLPGLY